LSSEKVFVTGREEITARSGENQRDFSARHLLNYLNREIREPREMDFPPFAWFVYFAVQTALLLNFSIVRTDESALSRSSPLLVPRRTSNVAPHEIRHLQRDFSGLEN
jgi:hypothetical protein